MTEVREKRLMRLKRCRLFNSAYLFKDIWGGKPGTFHFFLYSFSIVISQQHGVSTFYILSVVRRGMCFVFFLFFGGIYIYIYKKRGF